MFRRQNDHAQKTENHAQEKSRGFISLSAAAKLCTYSQEYLSLLARRGELQAQKRGRNWFTKTEWLKKYIEDHPADLNGNIKGRLLAEEKLKKIIQKKRFKNLNILGEVGAVTKMMKKKMAMAGTSFLLVLLLVVLLAGTVLAKPNYVKDFATMEIKLARAGIGEFKKIFWNENAVSFEAPEDFAEAGEDEKDSRPPERPIDRAGLRENDILETGMVAGARVSEVWKNFISKFNQTRNLNITIAKNLERAEEKIYLAHCDWQKIGQKFFSWLEKKNFAVNLGDFKMFGKSGEIRDLGIAGATQKILNRASGLVGKIGGSATGLAANIGDKIGTWLSSFQKTEWDSQLLFQLAKRKGETQIVYEGDWINQIGQGEAGQAGVGGKPGAIGATGKTGSQGLRGEKGEKGETGPQGLQGLPGLQGIAGPAGASGGTSITNVYNVGVPGATAHDGAGSSFAAKYIGAGELSVSGNTSLNGTLTVQGGASFNSTVNIAGILNGGNAVFSGATIATLNATTTNADILNVFDLATLNDTRIAMLNATSTNIDNLYVFNNATTTGVASVVGQLKVATSTLDEYYKFGVGGPVYIAGDLYNQGNATTTGNQIVGGNFGVSTTTYAATFNVGGSSYFAGNFYNQGSATTTGTGVFSSSLSVATTTHPYSFNVSGITYLADGLIVGGYATTSNLTVQGNATTTGSHYVGSDLTVGGNVNISGDSIYTGGAIFPRATATDYFYATNYLKIATTTSPYALNVSGTGYLTDGLMIGGYATTSNLTVQGSATTTGAQYVGGDLTVGGTSVFTGGSTFNSITTTDSTYIGGKSFLMGNVGIATTNPTAFLEISTTTNHWPAGVRPLMRVATKTTEAFYIAASGNVGIGTTVPAYKLQVNGGMTVLTGQIDMSTGYGLKSNFDSKGLNFGYDGVSSSFSNFTHKVSLGYAAGPGTATLAVNGNVGIGTTVPTALLHASSTTEQLRLSNGTTASTNLAAFTVLSAGDLIIDPQGTATTTFVWSNLITEGDATTTGNYYVAGNFNVGGDSVYTGGAIFPRATVTDYLYVANYIKIATTTSPYALNVSGAGYLTDGLFLGGYATTSNLTVQGSATSTGSIYVGGDLEVANSTVLGSAISNTLVVNSYVSSDLIPQSNAYNLGSSANRWNTAYVDTLNANNIIANATEIGGTKATDFTINSDNPTADTEDMSVTFERGTPVTNATFGWDSSLHQFAMNFPLWVEGTDTGGTASSTITVKAGVNQGTVNLFQLQDVSGNLLVQAGPQGHFAIGASYQDGYGMTIATTTYFSNNAVFAAGSSFNSITTTDTAYIGGKLAVIGTTTLGSTTLVVNPNEERVGLGTATPGSRLTVLGNGSQTGTQIYGNGARALGWGSTSELGLLSYSGSTPVVGSAGANLWFVVNNQVTAPSMAINTSGNVGIGTTDPLGNLVVFGGNVGIGTTTPLALLEVSTSTVDWAAGVRPLMRVATKTTEAFYISAAGNVGIGTTAPSDKLQVNGDISLRAGSTHTILFDPSGSNNSYGLKVGSDGDLTFLNESLVEKIRFTNGGNVGIGTTAPAAKLAVMSDVYETPKFIISSSTTVTTPSLYVANTGNVGIGNTNPLQKLEVTGNIMIPNGNAYYSKDSSGNSIPLIQLTGSNNLRMLAGYNTQIEIYDTAQTHALMAIKNNGNVGIGTTNPIALFEVSTTTAHDTVANRPMMRVATGTTEAFFVDRFGNVGIGTTGPGTTLEVNSTYKTITGDQAGDAQVNLAVMTSDAAATDVGGILGLGGLYSGASKLVFGAISGRKDNASNSGYLSLYSYKGSAGLTEGIRLTSAGNVGIGTTNPNFKLENMGTASTSLLYVGGVAMTSTTTQIYGGMIADADSSTLVVNGNENRVGIGTATPSQKLDVQGGNFNVSGTGTFQGALNVGSNVGIGNGVYSTTNGSDMGLRSGGTITFASTSGTNAYMTILSTGNVGISTTTPVGLLDVGGRLNVLHSGNVGIGTTNPLANLVVFGGNVGIGITNPTALFEIATTTVDWAAGVRPLMRVATKTTEAFYIDAAGNVGVGTTAPTTKVELKVTDDTEAITWKNNTGFLLGTIGRSTGTYNSGGISLYQDGVTKNIYLNAAGSGSSWIAGSNVGIGTTNPVGLFQVSTSTLFATASGTAPMVGIGTTAPLNKLHVQTTGNGDLPAGTAPNGPLVLGTSGSTGVLNMGVDGAGIFYSWIQSRQNNAASYYNLALNPAGGNVGIGATTPIAKFDVNTNAGNAVANGFMVSDNGSSVAALWDGSGAGAQNGILSLYSGGVENVRLYALSTGNSWLTGNVGIGTTAPLALLHASSTATQLRLSNGTTASTNFTSFNVLSAGDLIIDPQGSATSTVISSNLTVEGNATTTGAQYVGGHFNVAGIAAFTGGASFNSITTTDTAYIGGKSYFGGNVGLGATAPLAKLDVRGDMSISAGTEVWTNGGLESGGVTTNNTAQNSMMDWQGGTGNITPSVETTIIHAGTNSQEILVTDDGDSLTDVRMATASTNYNAVIGDVFTYSFWIYTSAAITNGSVTFAGIGQNGWGNAVNFSVSNINTWTKISGIVTCNATVASNGVNIQARIGNTLTGGTGTVYFDDFSIYRTGLALVNSNAAVAGGQQLSPMVRWTGYGWKTDATTGSQEVSFRSYVTPVQGAAAPTGYLTFESSINGAAYGSAMNFTSGGNLGIGTTAPTSTLAVYGNFNVQNSSNGTSLLYVNPTGGNVGIGGTGPLAKLQIDGTDNLLRVGTGGLGDSAYMSFGTGRAMVGYESTANLVLQAIGDKGIKFNVNNDTFGSGEAMRITSGSNVGIGTTNPTAKLHVVGTIFLDNGGITSLYADNVQPALFYSGSGGSVYPFLEAGNLVLQPRTTTANPRDIVFATGANTPAVRMIIDRSGNVGIATTNPTAFLEIATTTVDWAAGVRPLMRVATKTTEALYISAAGNVGIGTTAPGYPLQIKSQTGKSNDVYIDTTDATGVNSLLHFATGGNSEWVIFRENTDNTLRFRETGVQTSITILPTSGNVGIGTTNPLNKLHLTANSADGIRFSRTDATYPAAIQYSGTGSINIFGANGSGTMGPVAIYIAGSSGETSGNVGIGTPHPVGLFQISTSTLFTTASGTDPRVGIGTTAPVGRLDVSSGATGVTAGDLVVDTTNKTVYVGRQSSVSGDNSKFVVRTRGGTAVITLDPNASGAIQLASVNSAFKGLVVTGASAQTESLVDINSNGNTNGNLFVIQAGGNVGIGTTNPTSTLQIYSNSVANQTTAAITDQGSRTGFLTLNTMSGGAAGGGGGILFGGGNTATSTFGAIKALLTNGDQNSAGDIAFSSRRAVSNIAMTENMRIVGTSGNVGIGTTAPTSTLQTIGNVNFATTSALVTNESILYVNSVTKNVGIGTTAPTQKLQVNGNISFGSDGLRAIGLVGTKLGFERGSSYFTGFDLLVGNGSGMVINSSGNVGIGTTNPGNPLVVAGNFPIATQGDTASGLIIKNAAGTQEGQFIMNNNGDTFLDFTGNLNIRKYSDSANYLKITSDGNIGIATTNPTALFEIATTTNHWAAGVRPLMRVATKTTEALYVAASGAVGIGTTDPSWTGFDVNKAGFYFHNGATVFMYNNNDNTGFGSGTTPGSGVSIYENLSVGSTFYAVAAPTSGAIIEGNVGIGTTNPLANLVVFGGNVGIGITNPTALFEIATTTTDWAAGVRPLMRVATKTTEALYINAAGNVGIGNAAPAYKFIVAGGDMQIQSTNLLRIGTSALSALVWADNGGTYGTLTLNNSTDQDLKLRAGGINMYFDASTGKTGLGGTSPTTLFDISTTTVDAPGNVMGLFRVATKTTEALYVHASGNIGIGTTDPGVALDIRKDSNAAVIRLGFLTEQAHNAGDVLGRLEWYNTDSSSNGPQVVGTIETVAGNTTGRGGQLVFKTNFGWGGAGEGEAPTERMRIDESGNVGIGLTAPTSTLSVYGSFHVQNSTNGGTSLYVDSAGGSVGIGTSTAALTVPTGFNNNVKSKVLQITAPHIDYDAGLFLRRNDNVTGLDLWVRNSGEGKAYIDNRYNSDTGNIYFRTKTSATPVDAMTILGSGNIGIGQVSPKYLLDVAGNLNLNATSTIYMNSLPAFNASSTNFSVTAGTEAGNSLIGPTGKNNTFLGYRAGYIATTTSNNIAVGYNALYNVTRNADDAYQGNMNVAIGSEALKTNTYGGVNVAIGYQAMYQNTSGRYNTAIGQQAGYYNTIGGYNFALGGASLIANSTGSNNVSIGYSALYNSNPSASNIAIGSYSGQGRAAGYGSTGNVLVGYYTGNQITTGNYNIFFGYGTGSTVSTGSSNILIGYDLETPAVDTSNFLNIGNVIFGTAVNGAVGTGNVGIGTTAPGVKLQLYETNSGPDGGIMLINGNGYATTFGMDATGAYFLHNVATRNFSFGSNNSRTQLVLAGGGNVGIATSTPFGTFAIARNPSTSAAPIFNVATTTEGGGTTTILAVMPTGNVAIGTSTPTTTALHVVKSVAEDSTPGKHVVLIENSSTAANSDVLALKIGRTSNPDSSHNFISFFLGNDTSIGAIEGNGTNSVVLSGGGSDYAEWLARFDENEIMEAGDVVGVRDGKITKTTTGVTRAMAISDSAIVAGNDPGKEKRGKFGLVSFVGQVNVKVRGAVNSGDLIIPSGLNDGLGMAVPLVNITSAQIAQVVGQAWESSGDSGVKRIRTAIGLNTNDIMTRQISQLLTGNNLMVGAGFLSNIASTTAVNIQNGNGESVFTVNTANGAHKATTTQIGYFKVATSAATANTPSLFVDGVSGNVGVGTTDLTSSLNVEGTARLNGRATITDSLVVGNPTGEENAGDINISGNYKTGGADYAEFFFTKDVGLQPGEAVCVDVASESAVKRCLRGADPDLIGIVSTKPAVIGNTEISGRSEFLGMDKVIVGLIGQVPARASAENGIIRSGDSLTSASSTPGYLMKASAGDSTVGVALANLEAGTGNINVLISRRNKSLTVEQVEEQVTKRVADMKIEDEVAILISNAMENLGATEQIRTLNLQVMELQEKVDLTVRDFWEIRTENLKVAGVGEFNNLIAKTITTEKIIADAAQATTGSFQELVLGRSEERIENREDQATTTSEEERVKSEEQTTNNRQVRITVIDGADNGEVRVKISGGAEFGGTVTVKDLIITGKVVVMGATEFLAEVTFRNNLNLDGAIVKTYREKVGENLMIGDAVYISGSGEVARDYADVLADNNVFKPAIGLVVGFEEFSAEATGSLASSTDETRDDITKKVKVAIGGTVGGFKNLVPGVTYYLNTLFAAETGRLNNDYTSTTTAKEITSLTNAPSEDVMTYLQPMAVAESESSLLLMPSFSFKQNTGEKILPEVVYQPVYTESSEQRIGNSEPANSAGEEPTTTATTSEQEIVNNEITSTMETTTTTPTLAEQIAPTTTEQAPITEEPAVQVAPVSATETVVQVAPAE